MDPTDPFDRVVNDVRTMAVENDEIWLTFHDDEFVAALERKLFALNGENELSMRLHEVLKRIADSGIRRVKFVGLREIKRPDGRALRFPQDIEYSF